ncbi:MAG: hypothetical protein R3Y68_01490 [Rikenellaceae bacterium]
MKSKIIGIAQLAAVAFLAVATQSGCSVDSVAISATPETADRQIGFAPYSTAATSKATEINNTTIITNGFNVGAFIANTTDKYIPCTHLGYDSENEVWRYVDDNDNHVNYYWPADTNTHLTFLAHYPKGNEDGMIGTDGSTYLFGNEQYEAFSESDDNLAFKFGYTVANEPENQYDLIYALREDVECPATTPYSVHLPFCHALTQVAFTAELDPDLKVDMKVYKVDIHNVVYTGTFAVRDDTSEFNNNGVWWYSSSSDTTLETDRSGYLISEFGAAIYSDGVALPSDGSNVTLSDSDNVLMLMPQHISPWVVESYKPSYTDYAGYTTITRDDNSTGLDPTKAGAYLAISCDITQQVDGKTITIHTKDKWLYAPLTTNITYPAGTLGNGGAAADTNEWVAGYKITYNLCFGGGYSTIPGAEYPVNTLSEMEINATAEMWDEVDGGELMNN